jgi:hypothetical protein
VNYPAIMEERGSERDLMNERFNRLLDRGRLLLEHRFKMRSNNLQHQDIMFPVCALNPEMIQESENSLRPRMSPGLRRKMLVDVYLVILAGKFCHGKFEGDVSTKING